VLPPMSGPAVPDVVAAAPVAPFRVAAPVQVTPAAVASSRIDDSLRASQLDAREQALKQRERELAEQRRILAEEYRLLRARVSAPMGAPQTVRVQVQAPLRQSAAGQQSVWHRMKRIVLGVSAPPVGN